MALHCSEQENSDLFWAARGAGPGTHFTHIEFELVSNFISSGFPAIVTAFYLKTRETFKAMKNSTFIYPLSEYKPVMDWVQKVPSLHTTHFFIRSNSSSTLVSTRMRLLCGSSSSWHNRSPNQNARDLNFLRNLPTNRIRSPRLPQARQRNAPPRRHNGSS